MIDSINIKWTMTTKFMKRLKSPGTLARLGKNIYRGDYFYLKHPYGYTNIQVKFDLDTRDVSMEMSVPKLLQGHNVFGSNNVEELALAAIGIVYGQLGLEYTDDEQDIIQNARICMGRIDITCSFRLKSQPVVQDALVFIFQHVQAEGLSWSGYGSDGVETIYNGQRSTRVSDKFYNKYVELEKNKIPNGLPERERILKYAEGLLRFEVTLRAKELKRLGLDYADQWSQERVKNILMTRIAKFKLHGALTEQLEQPIIEGLSKTQRVFYALRQQGVDLAKVPSYAPLIRARNAIIADHGHDIFLPLGVGSELSLDTLLTAKNAYFCAPKGLVMRGAIF